MKIELAATLLALMIAACDPVPCRVNTIYLTLDYVSAAQPADTLSVDVTVAGTHKHYDRARTPGRARDTFEIVFGSYPAQQTVAVVATASKGGVAIGYGQASRVLAAGCTALPVSLAAGTAVVGGNGAPLDLSTGGVADLGVMMPPDLSHAPAHDLAGVDLAGVVPTIAFNGESDTELHPNGSTGILPYDTHCTAGYAIVGFAFAFAKDGNGNVTAINRSDALCVKPLVAPDGKGGFSVTWDPNHASQIPGLGTSDPASAQYLCPMPQYLIGFAGRAGPSQLYELLLSCAPIQVAPNRDVSLGPTLDTTSGVGSKTNGSPFGPVYCPAGQVATSVLSSGQTGAPPVSFGFGCSTLASQ